MFGAWEKRMNRQLLGLADPDLQHQEEEQQARGAAGHAANAANDAVALAPANANQAANDNAANRPRRGVLQWLLDHMLDHLHQHNLQVQVDGGDIDLQLEVAADFEMALPNNAGDGGDGNNMPPDHFPVEIIAVEMPDDEDAAPAPIVPLGDEMPPVAANNNAQQPQEQGLRDALTPLTNALASALLLPTFSAGMGELLRLCLPRSWTTPAQIGLFRVRTGLLQERWGRSLVGGCLFLVLRDAFRLYAKHRRVVNKPLRRVRNIDRRRGDSAAV